MAPEQRPVERDERVTSHANPTLRLARSLSRRRVRRRERALLVEGVRAVSAAIEHGAVARAVLIDATRTGELDSQLLAALKRWAGRLLFVEPALFAEIADTEHPQALIAICDLPDLPLPSSATLVVALDAVRDPGNLGTIARSCVAAGVDALALLPGTTDPSNPKAVRASAGAIFALPVEQFGSVGEIVERCFTSRPLVAVAEADAELPYDAVDWRAPALLVVGGEAAGAGADARTYADVLVSIPMAASIESLNAGVAASIIVFEARRQRRTTI